MFRSMATSRLDDELVLTTHSTQRLPGRRHRSTGWSIFDPSVLMPTAVLLQSALLNNSKSFARFCEQHHVSFAPHGKTTMSPELFRIQLRDGAWAITAATAFKLEP